jgi:hypothetical protein
MAGDQAERRPLPVLARQPQRQTHHHPAQRRQRRSLAQTGQAHQSETRPRRIGCPHSWRSQWRDWCAEAGGIAREVAEEQLQHTLSDVEGSYRRETLIEPRKIALQRWADWLTGKQTVVAAPAAVAVPLHDMRTMLARAIVRELERRHGSVSRLFVWALRSAEDSRPKA